MKNHRKRRGRALIAGLLAAVVWASAVHAAGITALILEKDEATRSIRLDDGRTLFVEASTVIEDLTGERVPFAELPFAGLYKGRHVVTGAERIEYEARETGGRWVASRIVLTPVSAF